MTVALRKPAAAFDVEVIRRFLGGRTDNNGSPLEAKNLGLCDIVQLASQCY